MVMVTAILCILLKREMPGTTALLYADDTLLWLPGNVEEVCRGLRKPKEVMLAYAEYTGQEMKVGKSKVVMQGKWDLAVKLQSLEEFEVVKLVRYLGIQLGEATIEEQCAAPMKKFIQKMTFLQSLPLSEEERAQAMLTWACPVF
mmetsp:Transcript_104358/g.179803  ORF Transcript_104358/g.179803 Transcript_104358/m.179803 type:complete len:145 (-) Transcript_104358:107-541(-)